MDGSEGRKTQCSERLELLRLRALKLSTDARHIDATLVDGNALVIVVYDGTRLLGTMVVRSTPEGETWHLCAECTVMAGLSMQADWLPEAARVVREVFNALVTP